MRFRVGLGRVEVAGRSMLPSFRPGDWLLVRWGAPARVGAVVVARRPDRESLLIVKRVRERTVAGWWLVGDNPGESTDSAVFGPVPDALILGRVVTRYWPLSRPRRRPAARARSRAAPPAPRTRG